MAASKWERIEELFHQAADLPAAERAAFLDSACGDDQELRRELVLLLDGDKSSLVPLLGEAVASAFRQLPPDSDGDRDLAGERIGHYLVEALIGTGGMGSVYRAVRVDDFQMRVAIKILKGRSATEGMLTRFRLERQVLATLDHPNIARLFDGGATETGVPYFVMEYVDGVSIDKWCETKKLGVNDRLRLFQKVCSAVEYAHEKQIIHRDIKPGNILITSEGQPKLVDFGIAKVLDPELPANPPEITIGVAPMTPEYASPEQVLGDAVGAATDIYALGATLYRLLTSQFPWRSVHDLMIEQTPVPPSAVVQDSGPAPHAGGDSPSALRRLFTGDLDSIVLKALRKQASERYASVSELSADIDRFLSDLPVRARKASAFYRGRKFVRRNRARILVAGLSALGVLSVTTAFNRTEFPEPDAGGSIRSLAVLPFDNLSGGDEREYFADGMTDAVINNLARIPSLRVISRTSVMSYKGSRGSLPDIARALGVQTIAEGSVLREGNRIRVSIRLIDAARDRPVWSGSYEGELHDVLEVQNRVAEAVAEEFHVTLRAGDKARAARFRRVNLDAYDAYLKGRHDYFSEFTSAGIDRAMARFQEALRLDGRYAAAWAGLADCYYMLSNIYYPPTEMMPKSKAAAVRALEIDDTLAEAHAALAMVRSLYEFNRAEAEKGFRRALDLKPSDAMAHLWFSLHLIGTGRFDEAIAEVEEAQRLDPTSPSMNAYVGIALFLARRYDQLIERLRPVAEMHPDYHHPHVWLALAYEQKRDWPKAVAEMEKAWALDGQTEALAQLGHIYASAGRTGEARRVLKKLEELSRRQYVSAYNFAVLYAALGDRDRAFQELAKAEQDRGEWFSYAGVDPRLDSLRPDPRFAGVLRAVGLTPDR